MSAGQLAPPRARRSGARSAGCARAYRAFSAASDPHHGSLGHPADEAWFHALADGARRAAQSHDLRAEVAFRRLLAQVTGVTRTEPEDALGAFVQTVRQIAGAPVEATALGPGRAQLPSPQSGHTVQSDRAIHGEAVEPSYDSEKEALRAFDEENAAG